MSKNVYTDKFIISLIRSVINNTTPAEFFDNIDWEYFLKIAAEHHISNILWYAIEKLSIKPPKVICDFLYQEHVKAQKTGDGSLCLDQNPKNQGSLGSRLPCLKGRGTIRKDGGGI